MSVVALASRSRWLLDTRVAPKAKVLVVEALVRMTFTSQFNENALRSLVVRLLRDLQWRRQPSREGLRRSVAPSLLLALERLPYREFMAGRATVSLDDVRRAAALASPNPDGYLRGLLQISAMNFLAGRHRLVVLMLDRARSRPVLVRVEEAPASLRHPPQPG